MPGVKTRIAKEGEITSNCDYIQDDLLMQLQVKPLVWNSFTPLLFSSTPKGLQMNKCKCSSVFRLSWTLSRIPFITKLIWQMHMGKVVSGHRFRDDWSIFGSFWAKNCQNNCCFMSVRLFFNPFPSSIHHEIDMVDGYGKKQRAGTGFMMIELLLTVFNRCILVKMTIFDHFDGLSHFSQKLSDNFFLFSNCT